MKYVITEEDGGFVAQCLDVDICSDGRTATEALKNLKEAVALYYDCESIELKSGE